jgi:hypothetical protein
VCAVGGVLDMWIEAWGYFSFRSKEIEEESTNAFRYWIALSTLYRPIVLVLCRIWRCRFDSSTVSPSTRPRVLTPAPAIYTAAGQPNPPAPTMSTEAARRRSWPVLC